ncbi:hypothetical protein [Desulfurobacterium sp. TC5-1]|uniref:hypothetical protein n=1 Tax=Desulfurobacterium sp. TC5-1 TaxID=1158318 RepID=UPI0003B6EC55|nr:hypothetical protein [Desulfurobacterium sp. TC5-1]
MTSKEVVSIFEEYDLRRKKIFLLTGEDGRKFRRILLEKDRLTDDNVIYLRELIENLYKYGFLVPAKALEDWLEERI